MGGGLESAVAEIEKHDEIADSDLDSLKEFGARIKDMDDMIDEEVVANEKIEVKDSVKKYLKEIGVIPLLSKEEELSLLKDIESARERYYEAVFGEYYALIKESVLDITCSTINRGADIDEIIQRPIIKGHEISKEAARENIKMLHRKIMDSDGYPGATGLMMKLNLRIDKVEKLKKEANGYIQRIKDSELKEDYEKKQETVKIKYNDYCKLRNRFADANLRLVVSIAKKYQNRDCHFWI